MKRMTALIFAATFCGNVSASEALDIPVTTKSTTSAEREQMRQQGMSVMLKRGVPIYPQTLLKTDPKGCVNVAYDILPDGKTAEFEVLKSVPPGLFDKVAVRSVQVSQFESQPQKTRISQIVTFSIVPLPKGKTPEADLIRAQLYQQCVIPPPKKKMGVQHR